MAVPKSFQSFNPINHSLSRFFGSSDIHQDTVKTGRVSPEGLAVYRWNIYYPKHNDQNLAATQNKQHEQHKPYKPQ
jgi:hypothetical protein